MTNLEATALQDSAIKTQQHCIQESITGTFQGVDAYGLLVVFVLVFLVNCLLSLDLYRRREGK